MNEETIVCRKCGNKTNPRHLLCSKCREPLSDKKEYKKERKKRIIRAMVIILPIMGILIFQVINIDFGTPINPESIDWVTIELENSSLNELGWVRVVEGKFAIDGKNLFFLVKWNGNLPSSINSNNLTAPRYLVYRKVYLSWTITNEGISTFFKGNLRTGEDDFSLFDLEEGYSGFREDNDFIPFINETTTVFAVVYQSGLIPENSLSNLSIVPTSEYMGYHQFHSNLRNLSDVPESIPGIIEVDGNHSDWLKPEINNITINSDELTKPDDWIFSTFCKIQLTRTSEGVYTAISVSNNDFTEFIRSQGNLSVKIYWATIIAVTNGSFAADYALETYLTYSDKEQYQTQNVTLTVAAGTGYSPSTVKTWDLLDNQSGTLICLECFFPYSIISPLFDQNDSIHIYSAMIIEWE